MNARRLKHRALSLKHFVGGVSRISAKRQTAEGWRLCRILVLGLLHLGAGAEFRGLSRSLPPSDGASLKLSTPEFETSFKTPFETFQGIAGGEV